MKYLLLIALFFIVLWLLRKAQAVRRAQTQSPTARAAESMVECALCGVNQPASESVLSKGRYYCCVAHQVDAEARPD